MSIEISGASKHFRCDEPNPCEWKRNTSPAPGAVYARDPATEASRLQTVTLLVTHFTHYTTILVGCAADVHCALQSLQTHGISSAKLRHTQRSRLQYYSTSDVRPVRTHARRLTCTSPLAQDLAGTQRQRRQLQFDPHQAVIIQVWHNTVSSNLHVTLAWSPKALRNGWRGHLARQPELGRGLVHARHQVPSLLRHDELKPSFVNHRTHLGEVLRLKP